MSELDLDSSSSVVEHNHEGLPGVTLVPSEDAVRQKSFEELMTEMENKITHLEDYLKRIGEGDEVKVASTYYGKFRDWLTNTEELPLILKPFVTSEEPISTRQRSYQAFQIDLLNSKQEFKTIYANVVPEHIFFGALGGMAMGYTYNFFKMPTSVYTSRSGWTKDITKIRVESNFKSLSYMTVVYKVAQRAAIGGFMYDFFKRNAEQATGRVNHWSTSVASAAVCGGILGIRGGFRGCAMGAAGLSISGYLWEVMPTLHSVT